MLDTVMLNQGSLLYLAQVADALSDLPDNDRAELLDEVQQHLLAIAEDADQITHPELLTRLGTARDYAAELRRSAGLPLRQHGALGEPGEEIAASVLPQPLASVWNYIGSLAPAWWAIRGYLVTGLIITLAAPINGSRTTGWHPDFLTDGAGSGPITGTGPYIVLAMAGLIAVSIVLGRTRLHRWAWLSGHALNLAAIATLATCPMWWVGPSLYSYYRGRFGG